MLISVRPEDSRLSEAPRPAPDVNLLQGTVDIKVFLGELIDFQVKVGERTLMARAHPSLKTEIGGTI